MKNLENQKIFANNINNKKPKILQYIDDHRIVYDGKESTKAELEAATKRIEAYPKKMSKQDGYNTYFNKKSPKYYKNVRDPSIKKKSSSPVEIDYDLGPRTAFIGLWPVIKDSSLFKLLNDPKTAGTELGYEGIKETLHLLQSSGLLKKGGRVK
jgi:hypothetical protein